MLGKKKFYYNLKTQQVEEGRQSDWSALMGPYPTREAAERALETARGRTDSWDDADRTWRREER
ncbi:MAG: SPOR domain-containing protein [Micrococcales bacterium]|nr:SPOR domain-containing protein [Micrococcales bacterium]